jgi:hypothetical protein
VVGEKIQGNAKSAKKEIPKTPKKKKILVQYYSSMTAHFLVFNFAFSA